MDGYYRQGLLDHGCRQMVFRTYINSLIITIIVIIGFVRSQVVEFVKTLNKGTKTECKIIHLKHKLLNWTSTRRASYGWRFLKLLLHKNQTMTRFCEIQKFRKFLWATFWIERSLVCFYLEFNLKRKTKSEDNYYGLTIFNS